MNTAREQSERENAYVAEAQLSMSELKNISNSSYVIFFFSSRRRHTRFDCDWSSDVCSSDLFAHHRADHRERDGDLEAAENGRQRVRQPDLEERRRAAQAHRAREKDLLGLDEIGRASCRERV